MRCVYCSTLLFHTGVRPEPFQNAYVPSILNAPPVCDISAGLRSCTLPQRLLCGHFLLDGDSKPEGAEPAPTVSLVPQEGATTAEPSAAAAATTTEPASTKEPEAKSGEAGQYGTQGTPPYLSVYSRL